ncbi:MAG: hypothetical protein KAR35_01990 [Candidatus Heimdallarchaeota archaeon]|nr:hypothetical protein [Candidatus Heimdallarchaeota archaeon]MCK5048124.1 hypothetical protein [Candidatus Heimdallarchaeota archaeon]
MQSSNNQSNLKWFEDIIIVVETRLNPTEEKQKLLDIFTFLLPGKEVLEDERKDGLYLYATAEGLHPLDHFRSIIERLFLLDTTRQVFFHSILGNKTTLYLSKNAASMGRFSFLERDNQPPLGAIYFTLISGNLEQVIDYVAPRTVNGEPVFSPDTLLE